MSMSAESTSRESLDIRMPVPPTGTDTVPTEYDSIFNWDYTVQAPELRTLYEKSKGAMWNAQQDIDWSIDVDPEAENMPNEMLPIFGTPMWDKLDHKRELPSCGGSCRPTPIRTSSTASKAHCSQPRKW